MKDNSVIAQIEKHINENHVVLFMKGTKDEPRCGFSKTVADILSNMSVQFKDIDVLQSDELRQSIKDYSNWPTIPQLYVNQKFIGGADIVQSLYATGDLQKELATEEVSSN